MVLWLTKSTEPFWLENNIIEVKRKHSKGHHHTRYSCSRAFQKNSIPMKKMNMVAYKLEEVITQAAKDIF
jgi:hypothetical protein